MSKSVHPSKFQSQVPTHLVSQATTQAPIPVRISPTIQVSTQSIQEYKQDFQSHATPIKIQSIGETQQKPGWPSPIHPLIPLMPQTALRRNVPATNQVPIHPRKQDLRKLHLSEIPSLDPKIQSLLQHKPKYQTNGESQQNPKFKCFGDNQPGPKFQPLLQPMIPQLQPILEIPCSNPSPTPSTNFTGKENSCYVLNCFKY